MTASGYRSFCCGCRFLWKTPTCPPIPLTRWISQIRFPLPERSPSDAVPARAPRPGSPGWRTDTPPREHRLGVWKEMAWAGEDEDECRVWQFRDFIAPVTRRSPVCLRLRLLWTAGGKTPVRVVVQRIHCAINVLHAVSWRNLMTACNRGRQEQS